MKKIILFLLPFACFSAFGQNYTETAKKLQQKYKDSEVAILKSSNTYQFEKDFKVGAKIVENKNIKFLSLRYNSSIFQTEVYDDNAVIAEFHAESNMKQKAPDGFKICGTYTSEGFFYDDSKFCTQKLKLKEIGEVWDLNFIKRINDPKYLSTIYFQEKYPLLEKKISFVIPGEIEVEIKEFNLTEYSITKTEKKEGNNRIIEYAVKELPGMERENLQRGYQYNHPHLLVLIKSATVAGKKMNILSSTQDLYQWYSSLTKELKPNADIYKAKVKELTLDKKTDEDKIKAIYYWVQDNIRYIAFEDGIAGFKPDEAHQVFEKRYGDCKGMANLTKEMLKVAGFDARLTWIGTKRIMYDQSYPSLAVNNHMICTLLFEDKKYYLDATEKYIAFGENAERIQGRPVMIEDGDKFIMDKVPEADKDQNGDVRKFSFKINGENLEGNYKINLKGESKKNFLYSYNYTKNEKKTEYVNNFVSFGNNNLKPQDLTLPNLEERSGALTLDCKLKCEGAVSSFNNEFYIDIDPAKSFNNWIIKESRQSDIDFGEKIRKKSVIELEIPKGLSIVNLPEGLNINHPEFSFSMKYSSSGNKITYTKEIFITNGIIKKSSFTKWNEAVKQLTEAYDNQISLKK